ncbi:MULTISPECIES: hypothetical protein [unclassified Novosphingobium]|uniref:hypothetical protein n=1 Tax=unclassified Novosphingobium TaxID=2644732 RepID=UPI00135AC0F2|nr:MULTISPECIES: hypothetical protein [unclassified Novosphingobium]
MVTAPAAIITVAGTFVAAVIPVVAAMLDMMTVARVRLGGSRHANASERQCNGER